MYRFIHCSWLLLIIASGCSVAAQDQPRPDVSDAAPAAEVPDKAPQPAKAAPQDLPGKFTFEGRPYRIVKAEITASIADPYWCDTYNKGQGKSLTWMISFETKALHSDRLGPCIDLYSLAIPAKNWQELVGYEKKWEAGDGSGDDHGNLYDGIHLPIVAGSLKIGERDGARFQIVATGKSDEGTSFSVDAPAEFKAIRVRGSERDSDLTILARLKQELDAANLSGTPFRLFEANSKYNSGLGMGEAIFTPKR